jgi:hypothetical protein
VQVTLDTTEKLDLVLSALYMFREQKGLEPFVPQGGSRRILNTEETPAVEDTCSDLMWSRHILYADIIS